MKMDSRLFCHATTTSVQLPRLLQLPFLLLHGADADAAATRDVDHCDDDGNGDHDNSLVPTPIALQIFLGRLGG